MRGYVVITLPAASLRMRKFFQLRQRNAKEDPRLRAKTQETKICLFYKKTWKMVWNAKLLSANKNISIWAFYSNEGLSEMCFLVINQNSLIDTLFQNE